MLIDHTPLFNKVWDRVERELGFRPGVVRAHDFSGQLPFGLPGAYAVYGIEDMTLEQIDLLEELARGIFAETAGAGERVYALDWHHSAFLYDPRNLEEQQSFRVKDERYMGGGYFACFPSFYPDGDYYFFIDEKFRFGCLGHPWRREIWIFGEALLPRFERVHQRLGWHRLR